MSTLIQGKIFASNSTPLVNVRNDSGKHLTTRQNILQTKKNSFLRFLDLLFFILVIRNGIFLQSRKIYNAV